jgi:hypothetical protein
MPPIKLTDDELSAVLRAAQPIAVDRRDAFLQAVALALQSCTEIGPGVVYRIVAAAQREFFDPPVLDGEETRGRVCTKIASTARRIFDHSAKGLLQHNLPGADIRWHFRWSAKQATDPLTAISHFG